jgi:hypothetical protein
MARYVLRYTGRGTPPPGDLERIRAVPDLTVLGESTRMLLVESPENPAARLRGMSSWVSNPEQTIPGPSLRPKVRSS